MAKEYACTACGHVGKAKRHTKGSIVIEIALWLMLIVPGLIYSLWRLTSRQDVCALCKHPAIVPVDTPKGREIAARA